MTTTSKRKEKSVNKYITLYYNSCIFIFYFFFNTKIADTLDSFMTFICFARSL